MHSYVRTSKPSSNLVHAWMGKTYAASQYTVEGNNEQRCKNEKKKSLLGIVPCAILLSGNKSHKLWLLVVMKFPEPLFFFFFFSFDQKAKESTFVSVFVFVCLLFFFFFFQKRSGMLREDFFLK